MKSVVPLTVVVHRRESRFQWSLIVLRGILIGLDGSEFSEAAVALSVRWARSRGAELVGLGIVDEPTIRKPVGLKAGGGHYKPIADEQRLADAHRRVDALLDEFAATCAKAGIRFRRVREVGLPSEQILVEAQRFDVIVLGKQSYFQFETREGPDETLKTVLHNAPRPVITVPRSLPEGNSVVVAYDGSVQAARALQAFVYLSPDASSVVRIVSVAKQQEVARERGQRAFDYLVSHGLAAELHAIGSGGDTATILLEKASEWNAGMIVMGAYGKRTIRDFFFGPVTRGVLRATGIPLFLFH